MKNVILHKFIYCSKFVHWLFNGLNQIRHVLVKMSKEIHQILKILILVLYCGKKI